MPIVTRALKFYRPQADGRARTREVHTDSLGNEIPVQYLTNKTEAAVTIDMNARNLTSILIDRDRADLLQWVIARNTVASFDYTGRDITQADGEEFIFQWFAESAGDDAIKVAWWMDSLVTGTFNNIRDRIGYTALQGSDITSRFTFMVSVEPWYEFTVDAP